MISTVVCVQEQFRYDPHSSIVSAYEKTDQAILSHSSDLGRGGSTAVTAILMNGRHLWVANVGDSRAVLSRGGQAIQMTVDHEPHTERLSIEDKGGFVSNMPGYSKMIIPNTSNQDKSYPTSDPKTCFSFCSFRRCPSG